MQATMKSSQGGTTQEERLKPMVLGNTRAAVRYLKDREGGGVLEPHTSSRKGDQMVEEVLKSKHPDTRKPGEDAFNQYEDLSQAGEKILPIDICGTPEMFAKRMPIFVPSNSRYRRSFCPHGRSTQKKRFLPSSRGRSRHFRSISRTFCIVIEIRSTISHCQRQTTKVALWFVLI
jgi:hypothetical protein